MRAQSLPNPLSRPSAKGVVDHPKNSTEPPTVPLCDGTAMLGLASRHFSFLTYEVEKPPGALPGGTVYSSGCSPRRAATPTIWSRSSPPSAPLLGRANRALPSGQLLTTAAKPSVGRP